MCRREAAASQGGHTYGIIGNMGWFKNNIRRMRLGCTEVAFTPMAKVVGIFSEYFLDFGNTLCLI
jgi:hypothetical protein